MIESPKELIWWVFNQKNVPLCYIDIITDMYEEAVTSICLVGGIFSEFLVSVGLHQSRPRVPTCLSWCLYWLWINLKENFKVKYLIIVPR